MFNLISKAVDGILQPQIQLPTKMSGSNEAKSFDLLEQLLYEYGYGGNYWSEANYPAYSFQGYAKNPVVNFCISHIAEACAGVKFILKRDDVEVDNEKDDLLKMLRRPNPLMSFSTFIQYTVAYKLISGNAYIWANTVGFNKKKIMEMYTYRPDRVQVVPNSFQMPLEYIYTIDGKATIYPVDPITFLSDILQLKRFHPLNDLYGLSPIQVALMGVDQHNEANEWNMNLLKNAGRPSGIYSVNSTTPITQEQRDDIVAKIRAKITGTKNAGQPIVAGAGIDWKPTGLSPGEMDWIQSKDSVAREICLAFKVPAYLLGLKDGSTFNNMAEARMSFYEETIIPSIENVYDELGNYISRLTNQNITMSVDKDRITALAPRRDSARNNAIAAVTAGIISINEARQEIDYDELPAEQAKVPLIPAGKLPIDFDVTSMMNSPSNPDDPTDEPPVDAKKPPAKK